jgi:hypothetical protein
VRAVFVNHCHPDSPHVCAVRLREFAAAMAARGHQVVLLTATLKPDDGDIDAEALAAALRGHGWSRPFVLACRPTVAFLTRALQTHRLPPPVSQAMVLWCYLAKGGVFWNWTAASRRYWPVLAASFAPDVVWASFGNVDALNIARGIAAAAGCPWVADIKDPWDGFIPAPLRAPIARRYAGAAALTALSETHRAGAMARFAMPAEVVYSGLAAEALDIAAAGPPDDGIFRLVLTGSTYDAGDLALLLDALAGWLAGHRTAADQAEFVYAGGDHQRVAVAAGILEHRCRIRILPPLDPAALAALQATASANLYIKGRGTPFHHKLIELLAAGRPVICHPAETPESARIAGEARVPFHSCADRPALRAAFDTVRETAAAQISLDRAALERYTWRAQAATLERVLARAAASHRENSCDATQQSPAPPRSRPAGVAPSHEDA